MQRSSCTTLQGCHLCDAGASRSSRLCAASSDFELELVDIGGDPELEARYRERLPVVEIDGEQAFTYFVDPLTAARGTPRLTVPPAARRRR